MAWFTVKVENRMVVITPELLRDIGQSIGSQWRNLSIEEINQYRLALGVSFANLLTLLGILSHE